MKNLLTAIVGIACLVLFSCQKEVDDVFSSNGSTSGSNGTQLVRLVSQFGSDSIAIAFSYNNSSKLISMVNSGTVLGRQTNGSVRIIRNSSNIITSTITKSDVYATIGMDSVVANCVWDVANARYKYAVAAYKQFGVLSHDSIVYNYSPLGKLVCGISYHDDGTGYQLETKDSVYYNGNNISSIKNFSYNGSGFDLDEISDYEQYDNKINPLQNAIDAPVLGMSSFYSANNVIKQTITDYYTGDVVSGTFTYTYNNNNRPKTSVSIGVGGASTTVYFYQ